MNNLERAQRNWETPPDDEPEARYCEECGEELEWKPDMVRNTPMCSGYWECTNSYCPEKWTAELPHNMAVELVETKGKLSDTQDSLNYVRHALAYQQGKVQEREKTIEELEDKMKNLETNYRLLSIYFDKCKESKEVLRDNSYQIRRISDTIEFLEIGEHYDLTLLRKEWNILVRNL
jgi:hypothetical protein